MALLVELPVGGGPAVGSRLLVLAMIATLVYSLRWFPALFANTEA